MLYTGFVHNGCAVVRYPRGVGPGVKVKEKMSAISIGKSIIKREGEKIAILNFGALLITAQQVGDDLNATVVDMRFVKPLDEDLIKKLSIENILLVTIEDNAVAGGAGSAVNEYLACLNIKVSILHIGLPDKFIPHGSREYQLSQAGLDAKSIKMTIKKKLMELTNK
jgi:1-deoxy-D-xylulose-5-phosphate synthase